MIISKTVVLNTNKEDSNYIPANEETFKLYNQYIQDNGSITLDIFFFNTIEDKRKQNIRAVKSIRIKKLEKMGVRAYRGKKTTYRIKYFEEQINISLVQTFSIPANQYLIRDAVFTYAA